MHSHLSNHDGYGDGDAIQHEDQNWSHVHQTDATEGGHFGNAVRLRDQVTLADGGLDAGLSDLFVTVSEAEII